MPGGSPWLVARHLRLLHWFGRHIIDPVVIVRYQYLQRDSG
jgi:hypothetical protein